MSARFGILAAIAIATTACSGYEGGGDVRIVPLDEAASQDASAPIADAGASDAKGDARSDASTPMRSLVAYYPFDGDGRDRSPAGRDLDAIASSFSGGHAGQALAVTQQGYVAKRASAEAAFALTSGDFTLQAWFATPDNFVAVGSRALGTSGPGWLLGANPVTVTVVGSANSTLTAPIDASSAWRHVVLRRSGGTFEVFVDGSSFAQKTLQWDASGNAFGVQATAAGTGRIDELAIWSRALTDAEIRALHDGTASPATLP